MTNLKKTALSLLSVTLLLAGSVILYQDWFPSQDLRVNYQTVDANIVKDLQTAFTIDKLGIYTIEIPPKNSFQLTVANYRDQQKQPHQAIIFPKTKATPISLDINSLRGQAWNTTAQVLLKNSDEQALFLTWWDNAQRLHLMTGRESWAALPVAEGFAKTDEQQVWQTVSGGFDQDKQRLKQLANWLTMDADQALQQIKATLPAGRQGYFLVSVEDLARLKEISTLSDHPLALQTRVFATTDNMHTQISQVKSWAKQDSTGSYLVQPVPGVGVRAWRVKDSATENSLLVRMLPFSHALEKPLDGIDLVYRSKRGSYLTIFRLSS